MSSIKTTAKRPMEASNSNGEAKKAAVGDSVPAPAPSTEIKNLPTRKGIQPNLVVENAEKVMEHLGKCTGASEYFRFPDEKGKMMHLAVNIGDVAMYVEEIGNKMYNGPEKSHVRLHMHMDDPLDKAEKLVKAGAKTLTKCEKQFWGSIHGVFEDPWGVTWVVANASNPIQDLPKELQHAIIPFVSVKDAPGYLKFLTEVFGAEPATEVAEAPGGKIMCAEMNINGGKIMIGDHCGSDEGRTDAAVTISHQVGAGEAVTVTEAFAAGGGEIIEKPSMQFWGQVWGRCKDAFGQTWGICEPQATAQKSKKEMEVDMRIGGKYKWRWSWSEEDVPKMYCFGEVREVLTKGPEIAEAMKEMVPAAFGKAGEKGLNVTGPAITAYFTWGSEEGGKTRLSTGPMVAKAEDDSTEEPAGESEAYGLRGVAGVKCMTTTHVGPYEDLMKCYGATFELIAEKGYESRMPVVEVYENDPKDTEPAKLRTKVCVPIVPKSKAKPADGESK